MRNATHHPPGGLRPGTQGKFGIRNSEFGMLYTPTHRLVLSGACGRVEEPIEGWAEACILYLGGRVEIPNS